MKNIIGNQINLIFKDSDKIVSGVLIETDDRFDYIQSNQVLCVIPKDNVLYYETDKMPPESKVIASSNIDSESRINIYVDKQFVSAVSTDLKGTELVKAIYSIEEVQHNLKGKKQKSVECFDDAVYIFTDADVEAAKPEAPVAFSMSGAGGANPYLSQVDLASRLDKVIKRG